MRSDGEFWSEQVQLNNRFFSGRAGKIFAQKGMTLVESILAMTVAAVMIFMLVRWQVDAGNDLRAKRNADSLQKFTQMAVAYLDGMGISRDDLLTAIKSNDTATLANWCVINAKATDGSGGTTAAKYDASDATNPKAVCAVDANWLMWKNVLPKNVDASGYALANPYGQQWVAIYRYVYAKYDGTNVTTQNDIEILVVATGGPTMPADIEKELGLTSQLLGGVAGMVPLKDIGTSCTTTQACGGGGAWKVDLSKFTF